MTETITEKSLFHEHNEQWIRAYKEGGYFE